MRRPGLEHLREGKVIKESGDQESPLLGVYAGNQRDTQTYTHVHRVHSSEKVDPPRPGIEPVSPTLAGRFFTTEPPGKPLECSVLKAESDFIQPHLKSEKVCRRRCGFRTGTRVWAALTGLQASDGGHGAGPEGASRLQAWETPALPWPSLLYTPGGTWGPSL